MQSRRLLLLIVVAALCVGGLVLVFSLSGGAGADGTGATARVRINEVMTSNKGAVPDEQGDFPDWVELYNPNGSAVDISGYGLTDDILSLAEWVFPMGTRIPANGYLVVYCSGDTSKGPLHASFKLSATDALVLSDTRGREVESMQLKPVAANATLGRDAQGNWVEMASPSPGFPNTPEGVQAYKASIQQTVEDNGVRINEFMASNGTTLPGPQGDFPDWIELYNTTDADVDVSGCGLSDDADQPMKYVLPAGAVVPARGVLLIYCSGREGFIEDTLHAPFGLRAYAEDVAFSGRNGAIIDSYSYTNQQTDISMARVPDGTGEFRPSSQPTPGFLNTDEGFAQFSALNAYPKGGLFISEAMANNVGSFTAEDGTSPDWIELYNGTGAPVNLAGYALSDNPKNPAKWAFPDVSIGTGEYMVVLATGNDVKDAQKKNLETSFGLSADGEVLLLYDPNAQLLDKLNLKNAGIDVSVGRTDGQLRYYDQPTPGAANGAGYAGMTASPTFSLLSGVYDSAQELAIEAGGADIYYTLDSSRPTASSTRYTGPIALSKNTVVRAVAIQEGYLAGGVKSGTYLFTSDDVDHQLPVASLVIDPDDLWNERTGIYVRGPNYDPNAVVPFSTANFYKKGEEWERQANFTIFDENGREAFSQNIITRIAGSYGRRHPLKGFNLIARASEGNSRMEYPFFENRPYDSYKALVLRAGAQDQPLSKIRDELSSGLLEDMDVNILNQAYKPYVLYLNGEYWGVYFLKEKRNRFFVAQHEEMNNNTELDLIKSSTQVYQGSAQEWTELMNYIKAHDLSSAEHYNYVAERVDIASFTDYMCAEIYVANSDYWNIQYYKVKGGKWKWIYYDFCWGWHTVDHKTVTLRRESTKPCSDLFNALLKNADWKDQFVKRMAELMNTVYEPTRVNALIDELYAIVEPEIERERAKFNQPTFRGEATDAETRSSYETFQSYIKRTREFANNRATYVKENLKSELGLSDSYMQEVFGG